MMRRCRTCQRLVSEHEHRELLRGPLWATSWAPQDEVAAVADHGAGCGGDITQGDEAIEGGGIAVAGRPETTTGNAVAHGHVTVNGHVTTIGRAASNSHDGSLAVQPPVPGPDASATPWVGRPIRRNGVLPSDVVHL